MRFRLPHFPAEFELPDEWLTEAGFISGGHGPAARAHSASDGLFDVRRIEPPYRKVTTPLDGNGFSRPRFVRILRGYLEGASVDPVLLCRLDDDVCGRRPYDFRVLDGYHRFYAAVVLGWRELPGKLAE